MTARAVKLETLAPGQPFGLPNDDGSIRRVGTLMYANPCRARVALGSVTKTIERGDGGDAVEFSSSITDDWGASTMVVPLTQEEYDAARGSVADRKPREPRPDGAPPRPGTSALAAAKARPGYVKHAWSKTTHNAVVHSCVDGSHKMECLVHGTVVEPDAAPTKLGLSASEKWCPRCASKHAAQK